VLPNEADDLLSNPFFVNAMKGMSMYAQSKNYYITYAFSKNEENELENIKEMTQSHLVDGIIMLRVKENDESIEYLKDSKFPFVVVGRPKHIDETLWVDNDNFQAMYNVVDKLIQKGHKRIGFIGAIKNLNMSKDRYKGYEKALEANKINLDPSIVIYKDEFKESEGQCGCRELLKNEDLTAIIATDDLLAFGVLKELRDNKIKNIATVGFNNTQLAQYQKPPLASVDINADKLGYKAAKLLIETLEEDDKTITNRHYIVNTAFIERDSFM
jgi:DNA-binding LacI/PurR family transcriptional regulator